MNAVWRSSSLIDWFNRLALCRNQFLAKKWLKLDLTLLAILAFEFTFFPIWFFCGFHYRYFFIYRIILQISFTLIMLSIAYNIFIICSLPNNPDKKDIGERFSLFGPSMFKKSIKSRETTMDSFMISRQSNVNQTSAFDDSHSFVYAAANISDPVSCNKSMKNDSFNTTAEISIKSTNSGSCLMDLAFSPVRSPTSPHNSSASFLSQNSGNNSCNSSPLGPNANSGVFNWSLNNQSPFIQHKTQLVSSNMPYCMAVPDKKEKKRLSQSAFTRNSLSNAKSPTNDTSGFAPITVLKESIFDSFWKEHKFSVDLLDHTILRLRKWIHGTILQRIVSEINDLNGKIAELDGEAHFIGSTSLASLKSMSSGKYLHLTTLNTLFPFLDCSKDQGYLVNRLKELSRGGCLDEYRADSGSRSLTHPWKEHLPSDTNIILHLVCAYLDTRIPIQPECLTGQKFSQTCIIRSPDEKPMARSKYDCKIYQTAVNPAGFKVVSGPKIYSVPEGRKCIFHALLMFFYHYLKLDGHIRMISLGPKGLNLSWVFEQ